jgi:hypothetical protein
MIKSISTVALTLSLSIQTHCIANENLAPPKCDYGKPHPSAPSELAQFSFLIGDYTIDAQAWAGKDWTAPGQVPVPARWNGWYGLDGMAIYDEWYTQDPGVNAETARGVNVRFYDDKNKEWKMMWTSSGTLQPQDLRAEIRNGVLTMWQVYPDRPNFKAEFFSVDDDNWYRISYTKDENNNWVKQYKLSAKRLKCS